ncbi:MAG: hypothetical protein V1925_00325, partial [Candidatus Omnitrophota bacterium]
TLTWIVKDYDYGTALENLTVNASGGGVTYWNVASDALAFDSGTKVYTRRFPYCTVSTSWSKEGYIGRTDSDRAISADITANQLLESILSSQQEYKVWAKFVYNEDTDVMSANSWLEKKGNLVAKTDPDLGVPSGAYIIVYDTVSNVQTAIATWTATTPDNNGTFWFSAAKATQATSAGGLGLASGKTYFTKIGIWYRSREYTSGSSFDISIAQKLKELTETIQTEVAGVKVSVATEALATRTALGEKIETAATSTQTKVTEVKTETAKILTATGTESLATKISDVKTSVVNEVKPYVQSGILNRENAVKTGGTIVISYRAASSLSPTVTVYNPSNTRVYPETKMKEVSTSGAISVYEKSIQFLSAWGTGDFTVVCYESTKGTADALVITVTQTDLATVAGQVSAVLGSTSGITGLKSVADTLNSQFNLVDQALSKLSQSLTGKAEQAQGVLSQVESVYAQLEEISAQIEKMSGAGGINLKKLYEVTKEKKDDLVYIKNKTEELKAAMEINQKMIENVARKPVVQTWFEFK